MVRKSLQNHRLCCHEDLPAWCKDNAFIVSGYRRPGGEGSADLKEQDDKIIEVPLHQEWPGEAPLRQRKAVEPTSGPVSSTQAAFRHDTIQKCWSSVWDYFHNESINIHTHLWGALTSIIILVLHTLHHFEALPELLRPIAHASIFMPPALGLDYPHAKISSNIYLPSAAKVYDHINHSSNEWKDTAGFAIFLFAAITCLGFSSSFHTLACHSHAVAKRFNALDYVGIVIMIVGSFLPALHYGFYCHPHWQGLYATVISLLGTMATWTVVSPRYATPEFRPYRTTIFLALGLSSAVPVAHGYVIYGYEILRFTMGLDFLVLSGVCYVVGALLYAFRIPERFAPGRFDFFGASHQVFHVFILLAAFSHYVCLRRAYSFWHATTADGGAEPFGRQLICSLML